MDPVTPKILIALSDLVQDMSSPPVVAVLYTDQDLASAVLVDSKGNFVDDVSASWRDERWVKIPDDTSDLTMTRGGGIWPTKANGGSIRASIAGRELAIPVGKDGWWTFIARVSDYRLPENQLQLLEDPE